MYGTASCPVTPSSPERSGGHGGGGTTREWRDGDGPLHVLKYEDGVPRPSSTSAPGSWEGPGSWVEGGASESQRGVVEFVQRADLPVVSEGPSPTQRYH